MTLLTPELLDTKTYGFEKLRYLLQSLDIQEGVVGATDLLVVQRALGANMSVDVGAGRGFIQADSGTRNGLYHEVNDAMINVVVTGSNATNPRIDQVILEVRDSSDLASPDDVPQLYVLAGTPTAGATLDNRTGAAALPNNAIRLADILVPAASVSVVTANIRDRRPWARGVNSVISGDGVADFNAGGATTPASVTGSSKRYEFSGAPVELGFDWHRTHGPGIVQFFGFGIDGAHADGRFEQFTQPVQTAYALQYAGTTVDDLVPAAGSHIVDARIWASGAGGSYVGNSTASNRWRMWVRENLRQNANNS